MCKKQTLVSRSSTNSEPWWNGETRCEHKKNLFPINVLDKVDLVPSNVQSSRQEALLYVFEDNETVTKMILKGRNPTMRHASRTHRVALDWLSDRISLNPKFQI